MTPNELNDITRYAFESYSFLIPQNRSVTAKEFAIVISRHYDIEEPRNREVISELNKLSGIFHRTWQGTTYKPLGPSNKYEIIVRDTGWKIIESDDVNHPGYQVASKDVQSDDFERSTMTLPFQNKRFPEVYRSKEDAWKGACDVLRIEAPNTDPVFSKKTMAVFEAMRRHVDSPESALKFFKEDFYKFDLRRLHETGATGEYFLIVRENGTEFAPLHYHPRTEGRLVALMKTEHADQHQYYLVDADKITVRSLDKSKALEYLNDLHYNVSRDRGVYRGTTRIATIEVKNVPISPQNPSSCAVHFDTAGNTKFSLRDLIALQETAIGEAIGKTGTLFAKVTSVTVGSDRVNLLDLIDRACEKEHAAFEATLTHETTQYGEVFAEERDRTFLESIGVEVGRFHSVDGGCGYYSVRVGEAAQAELEKLAGAFKLHLHPEVANIPIASMTPEQLEARRAQLRYQQDQIADAGEYGNPKQVGEVKQQLEEIANEVQRRVGQGLARTTVNDSSLSLN